MLCMFLILGINKSFSQNQKRDELEIGYFEMNMGFAYPLYMNNIFSEKMINPFTSNGGFIFGRYITNKRSISLEGHVSSYSFGHNDQKHEEITTNLIIENGVDAFGDIFINDWIEWDFGVFLRHSADISERFMYNASFGGGLILQSRRQWLYELSDDDFIYNVNEKGNRGRFASADLGINYYFLPERSIISIGLAYEMTYGTIPVGYEVRYGSGNDISIYQSYDYSNTFIVWRHRIKFKLRIDV